MVLLTFALQMLSAFSLSESVTSVSFSDSYSEPREPGQNYAKAGEANGSVIQAFQVKLISFCEFLISQI